jgi:hypothetical protein
VAKYSVPGELPLDGPYVPRPLPISCWQRLLAREWATMRALAVVGHACGVLAFDFWKPASSFTGPRALAGSSLDLAAEQGVFVHFRWEFNDERPHEALSQTPPARHYTPSPRLDLEHELLPLHYGDEVEVRGPIATARLAGPEARSIRRTAATTTPEAFV